jgi:hypothetical protein
MKGIIAPQTKHEAATVYKGGEVESKCHIMTMNGQLHIPVAYLCGKGPLVPIGREHGWAP